MGLNAKHSSRRICKQSPHPQLAPQRAGAIFFTWLCCTCDALTGLSLSWWTCVNILKNGPSSKWCLRLKQPIQGILRKTVELKATRSFIKLNQQEWKITLISIHALSHTHLILSIWNAAPLQKQLVWVKLFPVDTQIVKKPETLKLRMQIKPSYHHFWAYSFLYSLHKTAHWNHS